MTKKEICPNCEQERAVTLVDQDRKVKVRGEDITVHLQLFKCKECGEEFDTPEMPLDENDLAFRAYRKKHGLLKPEEIREIRESLELTQAALANLLGWSPATISRYETGTIQEVGHDRMLRALRSPDVRVKIVGNLKVPQERFTLLAQEAASELLQAPAEYFGELMQLQFEGESTTGNRPFEYERYVAMVSYFAWHCGGVPKTKLNKLLFFSDFEHYRKKEVSISGSTYVHLQYGPCPQHFQTLLGALIDEKRISVEEIPVRNSPGYTAEIIKSMSPPDESVFSSSEIEAMKWVLEKFRDSTSEDLTRLSHGQEGYIKTSIGEIIDYKYARQLSYPNSRDRR